MTIVADVYRYVVGVDTHAATHHYAVVESATGGVVDHAEFSTGAKALGRAADWIARRALPGAGGDLTGVLISMEGTRSYGAPLADLLLQVGYRVVDAGSPKRERGTGKNDRIDAVVAARGALPKRVDQLADARAGEVHDSLQILLTARNAMTTERTRALNALTALLRTHDLGVDARRKISRPTIGVITAWRTRPQESQSGATARAEAVRLARRIKALDIEVNNNERALRTIIEQTRPSLLTLSGVGPVNAATVLVAWSYPGRITDEAAFAKLGGVNPLEVSSGRRHEHRLNRTGDRQLNRALHSIAKTRLDHDDRTRAYLQRRTAEGLSTPRIRRCLKRYIARELFRHLTAHST
jgi:transposase